MAFLVVILAAACALLWIRSNIQASQIRHQGSILKQLTKPCDQYCCNGGWIEGMGGGFECKTCDGTGRLPL